MATEKLISVDLLMSETVWKCGGDPYDPYYMGYQDALDNVESVIDNQPTVEVVRCKDCKHYMLWEDSSDQKTCAKAIGLMISDPDDFCSYGERARYDKTASH